MATDKWKAENIEKMRAYRRKWYYKNKEHAIRKVRERKKVIKEWLTDIKLSLFCVECNESHPATLDFHHIDPKLKDIAVGVAANSGWSKEKIIDEMNKCVVLCSNCHRKLHYNESLV